MQNIITLNNNIRLLLSGHETFSAIKNALSHAERFINLEYFSFHDDETGNAIKNILMERSRKGVTVRMILDSAGSWRLSKRFKRELKDSGINLQMFMPFTIHRDHRKIITVDGITGFLGGFNIGDVYLKQWRDTHLKIKGDAVHELERIFFSMWNKGHHDSELFRPCIDGSCDDVPVRIIAGGTGKEFRAVADEYVRIINSAKKRIWITTPYFVPDKKFLNALHMAALNGVDVRIIIPSWSNHPLVSWASQSYIDSLLRHGIKIFIYRDRFIHAKTLIADSHVASVGTANLDALSFEINYEVQAFVYSTRLVRELEDVFIQDLSNCTEETKEKRINRPFISKIKSGIGRLLSSYL
ncbi:MAG: cardiolipin synthase [Synergistaceae bacterium]|nr:cardiolipin synthase [Synergistaceae bacterium]MBR0250957.1 cardiolipin synthase [Synergistaceae bacterium]